MSLLVSMHQLVGEGCQFVIATHAPIVLAYPEALIYRVGAEGIAEIAYDDTEQVALTREFLNHREMYLERLLKE
jgi:predicted ATPase